MNSRLLIINATSPYFLYVPMGTFGVCDFLGKHDITTKIINPALYPDKSIENTISSHLSSFQPTHVAILFHWQETAHGLIRAIDTITAANANLPLIVGGFSAGYFAEDLLRTYPAIDFIIKGDPERPLLALLQGEPATNIANLFSRKNTSAHHADTQPWLIDQSLLNDLSYARLDFLEDSSLYLEKIRSILGFPLFLGRGCVFNCQYCGGSRQAFPLHSHRSQPIVRSIEAVLKDLHLLQKVTDTIYICYENDRNYILRLFQAISEDENLRGHFILNYGAWHLVDQPFMELYKKAFQYQGQRPIFEFSPEVINDQSRKRIKGNTIYSLASLLENCEFISDQLQENVRIELFFSRYHPTEPTFDLLQQEIEQVFRTQHQLFLQNQHTVNIRYDHLSTDIASSYWQTQLDPVYNFSTFLQQKTKIDQQQLYPFPVDNLCFYTPVELSKEECLLSEILIFSLDTIKKYCRELFHILFFCYSAKWIKELTLLLHTHLENNTLQFSHLDLEKILPELGGCILKKEELPPLPFLTDLITFSITKISRQRQVSSGDVPLQKDTLYILNPEKRTIHQYNYLDLRDFISTLREQNCTLSGYNRTVYIYLEDKILSLSHRSYRETLMCFEKRMTISDYLEKMQSTAGEQREMELNMIEKLIKGKVLIPSDNK